MMTIKKLEIMPYAQAHIEIDNDGNQFLFSYTTLVAGIVDGWAFCNGLYSATTRKHISAFARENNMTYQMFRQLYDDNMVMDIHTGEVIDRY